MSLTTHVMSGPSTLSDWSTSSQRTESKRWRRNAMSIAAVLVSLCRFVERSRRAEQIYIVRSSERQVGEVFGV